MAIRGQKFSLDLDADDFQFDLHSEDSTPSLETFNVVREIQERDPTDPPPPPRLKSKSGFPEHRPRKTVSKFKQQQQAVETSSTGPQTNARRAEPSDRAIAHHIGQKYGFDIDAKEKAQISQENKKKLASMSAEEIEQARNELMSGLNPAVIQRLLSRANIDEDQSRQQWDEEDAAIVNKDSKRSSVQLTTEDVQNTGTKKVKFADPQLKSPQDEAVSSQAIRSDREQRTAVKEEGDASLPSDGSDLGASRDTWTSSQPPESSTHFPVPPRDAAAFPDLDPNSATFLEDLRSHYFPDTPHDPNVLTWLQDPTDEEKAASAYANTQHAYAPSDIRFDFAGRLIPPSESEAIPSSQGLHHHGDAPDSAGYTVPELAMLCRSSLPNQRCIAYQTMGRILYRLGRGDFGPKGTELNEGLWGCIEQERPLEVIMAEANRKGGHVSAKTYATEALWLWRKGGGDRGILKEGQRVVR